MSKTINNSGNSDASIVVILSLILAFFIDAIVGGNLLIGLFLGQIVSNGQLSELFTYLAIGAIIVSIVFAIVINKFLKVNHYIYFIPIGTIAIVLILTYYNVQYPNVFVESPSLTTNQTLGLVFNFVSVGAFIITSLLLVEGKSSESRGKITGISVGIALLVSGIILSLHFEGITSTAENPMMGIYIAVAIVIITAIATIIVAVMKPIQAESDSNGNQKMNKQLIISIIVAIIAFAGSGFAHTAVLNIPALGAVGQTYRALGFILSGVILGVLAFLSDKIGRLPILIYSIVISILSQILGFSNVLPEIVVMFEVGGYYGLLVFLTLQAAALAPSENKAVFVSAIWGLGLTANFVASIVANNLLYGEGLEVSVISGISAIFLIISLVLVLLFLRKNENA
jgi:hypothetical protein